VLFNASLREANYIVVIYEIRIKEILKNIKKKRAKTFIKINKSIYLKVTIEKDE